MSKRKTAAGARNPTVRYYVHEVEGQKYRLAFDFGALAEAEAVVGGNLLSGIGHLILSVQTATQLRALLWAVLKKAQPKMTLDEAAALIPNLGAISKTRHAIIEAYNLSLPEADRIGFENSENPPSADGESKPAPAAAS